MLSVFSRSIFCKEGETLIDTVNNILSMKVDMVVMRHANPGAAYFYSKM
jgi:aspartate carbamoyltransferase catalytic subunit